MSLLELVWWVSLALTAMALLVMTCLVLARLASGRRGKLRRSRRRELVGRLLSGQVLQPEQLGRLPPDLLAEIFVELIRLVRGEERQSFLDQAVALGVPQYLGRQLRRGTARERLLAAQALAEFESESSEDLLRRALTDRNADVRLAAALSLAANGHTDSVEELVAHLRLGSLEDSTLAVTLFRSLAADHADELKALLTKEEINVRVRVAALQALASTGDYSLVPLVTQLALDAPDEAIELPDYLQALGLLGHPAARPAIAGGLARSASAARAAAAGAAGRIGLVEFAGRLAEMLDDPEWWVRFRAAEALLRMGEPGIVLLREKAVQGTGLARDAAASILAENRMVP